MKTKKCIIIPTVFATSRPDFFYRLKKIEQACDEIHIDIMDGRFVHSKSIPIQELPDLTQRPRIKSRRINQFCRVAFEAHLMVKEPLPMIPILRDKGFSKIIAHIEALNSPGKIQQFIRETKKMGMKAGLALNPETKLQKVIPYSDDVDVILFLGVHPGKEHQTLIQSVVAKVREYLRTKRKAVAQIDGGINPNTIALFSSIGVRRFNSGSYTADSDSLLIAMKKLREAANVLWKIPE